MCVRLFRNIAKHSANRCPLCGKGVWQPQDCEFLVCRGCGEMLTATELVRRATRRSSRRYQNQNPGSAT